jgi:hypothetical protein
MLTFLLAALVALWTIEVALFVMSYRRMRT